MIAHEVIIRWKGLQDYLACWDAMRTFTNQRNENTTDEIWLLEHPPVFTQGQNGKPEHILQPGNIPVIKIDRGGQVTYHGPGQLIVYLLVDIQRKKINVRQLVTILENAVIALLAHFNIAGVAKREAPGVYVDAKKICSVGLRIRRGSSYHGLALNVRMDLEPFSRINPCGFSELKMTQINELAEIPNIKEVGLYLTDHLLKNLGYTSGQFLMENNHATKST